MFKFRDENNIHSPIQLTTRIAFTIAEVLIVLGIIGIIAEMTIPTLVQNVTNAMFVAQAKETYSIYQQIILAFKADTGCDVNQLINPTLTPNAAANLMSKYVKTQKICTSWATDACIAYKYKYSDGSGYFNLFGDSALLLPNGAALGLMPYGSGSPDCLTPFPEQDVDADGNPVDTNGDGDSTNDFHNVYDYQCGHVLIDVNGPKGPNQLDKDAYFLIVTPYGNVKYWDYMSDINYVISHGQLPPPNSYN